MIYLQANSGKTLPHHFDVACALYGAKDSKINYKLVTYQNIKDGLYDEEIKNNLFVGTVEFMKEVFNRVNIKTPALPKYSERGFTNMTLKEAKKLSNTRKVFIKPEKLKLFTGLVLDGFKYSEIKDLPDDTSVRVYPAFKKPLLSEWRIYIKDNKIIDSRNYSGDFLVTPDYSFCFNLINKNKHIFPRCYTLDVGIFNDQEQTVIEYNDMWAIGNYGVPNYIYVDLLQTRYFEILKDN